MKGPCPNRGADASSYCKLDNLTSCGGTLHAFGEDKTNPFVGIVRSRFSVMKTKSSPLRPTRTEHLEARRLHGLRAHDAARLSQGTDGVIPTYSPADLPVEPDGAVDLLRTVASPHNSIRHLSVALCTHQPTMPRTNGELGPFSIWRACGSCLVAAPSPLCSSDWA